jgi:hypothetical protein
MPARTARRTFIRYGRISTFPGWFGTAARTRLRATPGKPDTACCAIFLTRRQPKMPEHPQRPRDPHGQTRPRQADGGAVRPDHRRVEALPVIPRPVSRLSPGKGR